MRKFGLFLCLSLLFAFTGCSDSDDVEEQGGTVLAKPTVVVTTTTSAAFKVKWDAVPNAESYKYRLSQENESGEEITVQSELATSANALAFSDLNPKTKYILRVKAVAAGGSGLADSDYAKIFAMTLAEEPTALTFEKIAATNPTYESIDVEIVPSAENLYYWQVVENSLIADKSDREIVAALKENISELTSGTVKKTIHGLKAETGYTIVAFGYDIDANKSTSAVARLEKAFTTPADTRMTIRIAVGEVSDDNAHVTFTPSVADGRYFADVIAAADAAGKSDMEIVALLQAKYGAAMTDIARTGKYEMDAALEAKTNYVAVAFGYDVAASEFLTQLFRADIKNGGANPDFSDAWADMACVYGSFNDGSPALGANVYPNEQTASIKMGMLTLRGSASSLEEVGLTAEQLRDEILKQGETLPESLKDEDGSYQAVYHIEYGKVYLFANVALDAAGKGGEVNWFIARAQTSAQGAPEILGMSERNDDGSEEEEPTEAYSKYLGTWTVTSTTSLVSQKPLTFDITIAQDQANVSYAVTGWSISSIRNEIPVRWNYETYEGGDLIMLPTQKITAFDDPDLATTVTVDYQPFCKIYSENLYTPIRFEYGSELIGGMMMEDKFLIIGLTNENVGSSSSPMYIDAYTMDFFFYYTTAEGNMVGTYKPAPEFTQNDYPVGPFMLTKKSDATNSTAKRKSSTIPVNTFAIRSMSSVLRDLTVVQPQLSIIDKVKKLGSNGEKSQMRQIEKGEGHFQVCQPDDKRIFKHRLSQLLR